MVKAEYVYGPNYNCTYIYLGLMEGFELKKTLLY